MAEITDLGKKKLRNPRSNHFRGANHFNIFSVRNFAFFKGITGLGLRDF